MVTSHKVNFKFSIHIRNTLTFRCMPDVSLKQFVMLNWLLLASVLLFLPNFELTAFNGSNCWFRTCSSAFVFGVSKCGAALVFAEPASVQLQFMPLLQFLNATVADGAQVSLIRTLTNCHSISRFSLFVSFPWVVFLQLASSHPASTSLLRTGDFCRFPRNVGCGHQLAFVGWYPIS